MARRPDRAHLTTKSKEGRASGGQHSLHNPSDRARYGRSDMCRFTPSLLYGDHVRSDLIMKADRSRDRGLTTGP
jgi:hypothetical protein